MIENSSHAEIYVAHVTVVFIKTITFVCFSQIPFFLRGGSIIPTKERLRRSSALMMNDPYSLIVALNKEVRMVREQCDTQSFMGTGNYKVVQ